MTRLLTIQFPNPRPKNRYARKGLRTSHLLPVLNRIAEEYGGYELRLTKTGVSVWVDNWKV